MVQILERRWSHLLVLPQELILEIQGIVGVVRRKTSLKRVGLLMIVCRQGLPVTGLHSPLVILKLLPPVLFHYGHREALRAKLAAAPQ